MLIPHLHFSGECRAAMTLYQRAFGAQTECCYMDGAQVSHAVMNIRGQRVFLNDRFGNRARLQDCAVHLIVMFDTPAELTACYDVLADGGTIIDPLEKLPYSRLAGNFMDRFGVMWGLMVK